MGGCRCKVRRHVFGRSAGDLQPKGIRAKVELVVPAQLAVFADASAAEELVVLPRRIDASARFVREVHLAFHAVVEAEPEAVVFKDLESSDFFHRQEEHMAQGPAISRAISKRFIAWSIC